MRAFAELSQSCAGRHILATQDTSDINFTTTRARSRGPGEIGKGSGRGVLLHAMPVLGFHELCLILGDAA